MTPTATETTAMAKVKARPGATPAPASKITKPRQFRFTDAEIDVIDRLAATYRSDPSLPVTRTDVLRIALRELAERRLEGGE